MSVEANHKTAFLKLNCLMEDCRLGRILGRGSNDPPLTCRSRRSVLLWRGEGLVTNDFAWGQ